LALIAQPTTRREYKSNTTARYNQPTRVANRREIARPDTIDRQRHEDLLSDVERTVRHVWLRLFGL
jgi:hypothetical protein